MKKNYHHSRKYRQLKYAVKQLKKSNRSDVTITRLLVLKIKRLASQLKTVVSTYRLKRLVTPVLLILGTALQSPVNAQDFAEPVNNPFGILTNGPLITSPVLIDIDGDNDLDVFTHDLAYNYLSNFYFQENIGSSTEPIFDQVKVNPFGLKPALASFYPSFGDLDDDGDLDFIVGTYYSGINYYENTGTAQKPEFDSPLTNQFNIPGYEEFVFPEFADMDGDEDLDILATNVGGGDYYYVQNIGDKANPEFDTLQVNSLNINLIGDVTFLRAVDMDNDADLDIVAGSQLYYSDYTELYEAKLLYFENTGDATSPNFQTIDRAELANDFFHNFAIPTLGDLDADGDYDLLSSQFIQPTLYFENEGNANEPLFNNKNEDIFGLHQFEVGERIVVSSVDLVDLDADGDLDLVVGGAIYSDYDTPSSLKFYENLGTKTTPQFTLGTKEVFKNVNTNSVSIPEFTDVDNDGDLDLFVTDYYGKITFFENVGNVQNPSFVNGQENPFGLVDEGNKYSRLVFADMDNDGDEDGFYNKYGTFTYFENQSVNGNISFSDKGDFFNINLPETLQDEFTFYNVADLDVDGDYDLWTFIYENASYYYFENIGTPSNPEFADVDSTSINISLLPLDAYDDEVYLMFPAFADLDADGDQDLMFGSYYGSLFYYENIDSIKVDINENEMPNFSLFPNPTQNIFYIDNFETIESVKIFNSLGQTVKQIIKPQQSISLNGLPSTTYFVKITDKNGAQKIKKIYKQ